MHNKHLLLQILTGLVLIAEVCTGPVMAAATTSSDDGIVTVQPHQITPVLSAYAQIVPIATLKIRALARGNLSHLEVVPGAAVSASQVLARLTGPLIQSRITTSEQKLQTAHALAKSADQALRIARRKFADQLTTRQQLNSAISNLAAANAEVKIEAARLNEIQNMQTLRAPVKGTVISVKATNGEQTLPDQIVMTLLPANKLWLRAEYYGDDIHLLHPGMSGEFKPSDSSHPVAVKVVAIAPNLSADSGRLIELVPATDNDSQHWISGTWGNLNLNEAPRSVISVPTSALILDHGKWWVLLHTSHGNIPHEVIPGIAHGWSTIIRSGLEPGQQIVVKNAYLRYHHGIARSYMLPD